MSSGHSSGGIGDAIKKGVGMVHGTGEAIRGNVNAALDQAGGDRVGVEKNTAIASKGANEIEHGYHRSGHGAGVTPVDTEREHLTTSHATSTNHGPHTTNTANKLDPRFDSDVDHRANPDESSPPDFVLPDDGADPTAPPWSKFCKWVLSNRSDPNQEHDEHSDCVAYHIHRGSISGGTDLEAAQKLDPILSTGEGLVASNKDCADGASQQDCKVDLPLKRCDGDTSMNSGVTYKGWKQTRSSGA